MNILVPVITRAMLSAKLVTDMSRGRIIREDTRPSHLITHLSNLITSRILIISPNSLIMGLLMVS